MADELKNVSIRVLDSGYVVTENGITNVLQKQHAFESFLSMTQWLEANLKHTGTLRRPDTQE